MIKKFLKLFGIFLLTFFVYNIHSLSGWQYFDLVIINNTQNPNNLTNYIALITLNTQTLIQYGEMRPDCGDIRFTDSDGNTLLNYWIEPNTCNTNNTKIWVKVPFIPGGSSKTIYLWYGNPNATSMSNVYSVFGNGLVSLYTFTECSGSILHDYVGGINLPISGLTWKDGFRQGICSLTGWTNGGLSYINANGPNLGSGSFTVIAFIYPTSPTGSTQGVVGNYYNDNTNGWVLKLQGSPGQFMLLTNQQGNWCQFAGGNLSANNWYMIAGVRVAGSLNYLYQNGVQVGSGCSGDTRNVNNNGPFAIGTSYSNTDPFNGNISFIAIYNISLSATQIQDLYNSLYVFPEPTISIIPGLIPTISVNTSTNFQFNVSIQDPISEYVNYTVYLNGSVLTTNNISVTAGQTLVIPYTYPYLFNQSGTYNLTVIIYGQSTRVTAIATQIFTIQLDQLNVSLQPYYTYNNVNYTNLYNSNLNINYYCMRPNNTLIIYDNVTNKTLQFNLSCNYIQTINNLFVNLTPFIQNNTLNYINGSLTYGSQLFNLSFIPLWNTINITLTTNIPGISIYTSPISLSYSMSVTNILPNVVCNISFYDNNTLVQTNLPTLTNSSVSYSWNITQTPIHNFRWNIYCYDPVNVTSTYDYLIGPYYYNQFNMYMEDSGNVPANITYSLSLMCSNSTTIYSNSNMNTYTLYLWTNDQCNSILISQQIQGITFSMSYSTNLLSKYSFQWPICLINTSLLYYSNLIIGSHPYQDTLISVSNIQTGCYLLGSYLYLYSSNVYYAPIPIRIGALYSIRVNNTFLATVQGQQQQAISIDSLVSRAMGLNNQTINIVTSYPTVNYTNESGVPKLTIIAPINISSAIVSIYYNDQLYTNYTFNSIGSNTLNIILTNLPANYTFNNTNYLIITLKYINGYQQIITYPTNFFSRIPLPAFLVYFLAIILLYAWTRTYSYYQKLIFAGFGLVLILVLMSVFIINSIAPLFLTAGIFLFFIVDVASKTYLTQLTQDHPLFKLIGTLFKIFMVMSFVGIFVAFLLGPQGLYQVGIPELSQYIDKIQSTINSADSTITQMQQNVFFVPLGIVMLAANIIQAIWLGIQVMAVLLSFIISPLSIVLGPFANILAIVIKGLLIYGSIVVIVVYMIMMVFALAGKSLF